VKRIVVTGPAGAGKSRLARELGDALAVRVLHLDAFFWRPGWVATPEQEFDELQRRELAHDAWVVDGQYDDILPDWFDLAELIVFVDASPFQCLWQVSRRRLARDEGPHVPGGKPAPLHRSLFKFARLQWHYRRRIRPQLLADLAGRRSRQRVVVIRSRRDAGLVPRPAGNPS
jgi:adenylate kinase family enzyme